MDMSAKYRPSLREELYARSQCIYCPFTPVNASNVILRGAASLVYIYILSNIAISAKEKIIIKVKIYAHERSENASKGTV